jgi:GTP diphosphokinase / guanosine-3',5'-bis(diphosphate) 3'-diphosphatase
MQLETILDEVKRYHPEPDLELITRAYEFAAEAHHDQIRESGEPYLVHLMETSFLVSRLKLDVPTVASALLHDCLEDCPVDLEQLLDEFGEEITQIVEGVTKLTRLEDEAREVKQAENFRKMLIAMAKDIRVILVKLCDRLHNMRTLQHALEEKRLRVARETKEIYAPLANRLGIYWIKSELEDLCLLHLRPALYERIKNSSEESAEERKRYIETVNREIIKLLEKAGISASVSGRAKNYFSIWQKMEKQNRSFEEIHDRLGFRIIVPTVRACYESLGLVHSAWKPIPGRFKDYVAMPKPNMYQSLHTTVIGPDGQRIEIQIRTPEMNSVAEEGIAAHWRYKEGGASKTFDLQWVRELVETQQYLKNPDEFIQSVKGELFPEEVFVFTPKGDLIRLPYRATPVDFAYAVHTDVGHTTSGAKVNGSIVPLSYQLENGDTVEVITSRSHVPSKDWLKFVQSSKAKQRIRSFLKSQEHERSLAIGVEIITKDLRKVKLSRKKLEKEGRMREVAQNLGFQSEDELYTEIGYGKISSEKVLARLLPEDVDVEERLKRKETPLRRIIERATRSSRQKVGVTVGGLDNILVRFAKCCEPLPGDRIVGFITRGRGVTIHRADCGQILGSDPRRQVEVNWDTEVKTARRVRLTVHSEDKRGLLAKVSTLVTERGVDIKSAQIKTTEFGKAIISLELSLEDAQQLRQITHAIEMVPGVIKVVRNRLAPGPSTPLPEKN